MSVVPNLPGFVSNKPQPRPLPQTFNATGGIVFEKRPEGEPEIDFNKSVAERGLKARAMPAREKTELFATKTLSRAVKEPVPAAVVFEKQVWQAWDACVPVKFA